MSYKNVSTPRLAEQVKSQLKQSIFDGRYAPGKRMPSEHEMVDMFGVSRVIVRMRSTCSQCCRIARMRL